MVDLRFPKRIAFIVAHPDDETEIAAGTIYLNKQKGGKNFLFCATKGEKGKAYVDSRILERNLGEIREKELRQAGEYLGVTDITVSDFADGDVSSEPERLFLEVKLFIERTRPEIVISFGEGGYSGHYDHIAIYDAVNRATKELSLPFIEFSAPSGDEFADFRRALVSKRRNGIYTELEKHKANIVIEVNKEVKLEAMRIYKTQFPGLDPYRHFPKEVADHILKYEYFYIKE